jgi:hypothetical protein
MNKPVLESLPYRLNRIASVVSREDSFKSDTPSPTGNLTACG